MALLTLLVLPDGHYLGFREGPSEFLVFYGEGVESTVAVFDIPQENFKVSFVNGRIEVPTDEISMRAFRLLGHLPPLLKPDAERALMLSFGNGIATGSLATHGIPRIEAVDLAAEQFEAAEIYWQENHNVLDSPQLQTHVEDGRNFCCRRLMCMTSSLPMPPTRPTPAVGRSLRVSSTRAWMTAWPMTACLCSGSRFTACSKRTTGRSCVPSSCVFPDATLWYTGGSHTLLLATPQPATDAWLAEKLAAAQDNQVVTDDIGPALRLGSFLAMDEDELRQHTGEGSLVRDNNAYFSPHADETERILAAMREEWAGND